MEKVKDLEIRLTLKDFKGVKNGEYILEGSYLYLIKGKNKLGKTSIAEAFISLMKAKIDTPDPIKKGEKSALIRGILPGPKGMYTVEVSITEKGAKFIMFTPDNIKVNTVTEIRKVFEYNILSVEDFIRKSYTPEGRRQQIKMILSLLPEKERTEYLNNLKDLDPKKSPLYERRREIESQLKGIEMMIEEYRISKEEAELLESKETIENEFKSVSESKKAIDDYEELKEKAEEIDERIENIRTDTNTFIINAKQDIANKQGEIERLQAQINSLKENIDAENKKINDRKEESLGKIDKLKKEKEKYNIVEPDPEMTETIISEYGELEYKIEEIEKIEAKNEKLVEFLDKKKKKEEDLKTAQNDIDEKRKLNREILNNSDLKSYNIEIKDDTLYVDGLIFNEHQIADSVLTLTATKILAKTLKSSQIMVVGKLAELDKDSKKELYKIGKENNIAIIGDDVDDSYENIYVSEFIPEDIPDVSSFVDNISLEKEEPKEEEGKDVDGVADEVVETTEVEEEPEEKSYSEPPIHEITEENINPVETRNSIENNLSSSLPFDDNDLI